MKSTLVEIMSLCVTILIWARGDAKQQAEHPKIAALRWVIVSNVIGPNIENIFNAVHFKTFPANYEAVLNRLVFKHK